jgi:hypothetical protein
MHVVLTSAHAVHASYFCSMQAIQHFRIGYSNITSAIQTLSFANIMLLQNVFAELTFLGNPSLCFHGRQEANLLVEENLCRNKQAL